MLVICALAATALGASPGEGPALADPLPRDAFVDTVLSRHPSVAEAAAAVEAARAAVPMAGGYPEPVLSWSIAPVSLGRGQTVQLDEAVPIGGRLGAARRQAEAEVDVEVGGSDAVRRDLALEAALAWEDWWAVARRIQVDDRRQQVLGDMLTSVREQYAQGRAPQLAVLDVQLELARVRADRAGLEGEQGRVQVRLDRLLDLPSGTPIPPASEPTDPLPPDTPGFRPDLAEAEAMTRAARLMVDASRKENTPDLMLMTSFSTMWDDPAMRWMVGVGTDLPLAVKRRRATVDAARAGLAGAEAAERDTRDRVDAEAAEAGATAAEAEKVLAIHRDELLPLSQERLEAASAAFASGDADIDALIGAERDLVDAEIARIDAEVARRRALLEWRFAAGASLTSGPEAP